MNLLKSGYSEFIGCGWDVFISRPTFDFKCGLVRRWRVLIPRTKVGDSHVTCDIGRGSIVDFYEVPPYHLRYRQG